MDKEIIIEYWMKCWEKQQFPEGIKIETYTQWREFRDFWLDNPLSDINKVVILYNRVGLD